MNDALAALLRDFDYRVECDSFLIYEIDRLIEDDRASFEDEEFRRIIDTGIHDHVDTQLSARAEIAARLRNASPGMDEDARRIARRVLKAVEDTDFSLRNAGVIVHTFTAYMFNQLEKCTGRSGEDQVAPVADLLFDSLDDRKTVAEAIGALAAIPSAVSARILAHVVSEPMLDEDLEMKAYESVRSLWPLPRQYVLYGLRPHTHEDLPYRWFQLLVEADDLEAVDRIVEEVYIHAENPDFREDLIALLELLRIARDPATEEKILQIINTPETPKAASKLLEGFVKTYRPPPAAADIRKWQRPDQLRAANKKYRAAAKLFDAGRKEEALRKLNDVLKDEPGYPLALMLKQMI